MKFLLLIKIIIANAHLLIPIKYVTNELYGSSDVISIYNSYNTGGLEAKI